MSGPQNLQDAQLRPCSSFFGPGKRQSQGSIGAPGTSPAISSVSPSSLYHKGAFSVFCRRLRRAFLVDSGADVSVFPALSSQRRHSPVSRLTAANGTSIRTYGRREFFLSFPKLRVHMLEGHPGGRRVIYRSSPSSRPTFGMWLGRRYSEPPSFLRHADAAHVASVARHPLRQPRSSPDIPSPVVRRLLDGVHSLAHAGGNAMLLDIRRRYVWTGMATHVK